MIEYYTIGVIALLAAVSPGPDFVIVAKNALLYDRRSALVTSVGIGAGVLVHSFYCVLGLAVIISQSLLLFSLIKYLGAAYLIYLGVKSLLSKKSTLPVQGGSNSSLKSYSVQAAFRDGLLTNVLNPKCTLFMLSIFTLVVKPHTSTYTQASYGLEIALITTAWFIFLSVSLTYHRIKAKIEKVQNIVSKLIGTVLIALGLTVVFES